MNIGGTLFKSLQYLETKIWALHLKKGTCCVRVYMHVFWSTIDHIHNGGPIDLSGAENFLSPSDVVAAVML